jgi:hypothetical protein
MQHSTTDEFSSHKKKSQSHSFDVDIANELGIECAVVFNHVHYWITHNRIHKQAQRGGNTWTFQSMATMHQYLTYLTQKQIRLALDKLLAKNYLIKGNFNKNKFDRTAWYAFPMKIFNEQAEGVDLEEDGEFEEEDSNKEFDIAEKANGCYPKRQMDIAQRSNLSISLETGKEDNTQTQGKIVGVCDFSEMIKIGSHVKLKQADFDKLKEQHGEAKVNEFIEAVNDYCAASKPKGYSCYLAAIRNFIRRAKDSPVAAPSNQSRNDVQKNREFATNVIKGCSSEYCTLEDTGDGVVIQPLNSQAIAFSIKYKES